MTYMFKGIVCSDLETIRGFIDKTLYNLSEIIKDEDAMFDIKVILNELIVNGALHGNKCMISKCVSLRLQIIGNKLVIEVQDEGKGIDFDISTYDPTDLKSCGRGLIIANGLSDEFHVERNRVVAIKNIN